MKTLFEFNPDDVCDTFAKIGLTNNDQDDHLHKWYDKEIDIKEGERIALGGDFWKVKWKAVWIEENYIEYSLELE